MTHILALGDKGFKKAIINIFKDLKGKMLIISEQMKEPLQISPKFKVYF